VRDRDRDRGERREESENRGGRERERGEREGSRGSDGEKEGGGLGGSIEGTVMMYPGHTYSQLAVLILLFL
jgi:hypothetical protein